MADKFMRQIILSGPVQHGFITYFLDLGHSTWKLRLWFYGCLVKKYCLRSIFRLNLKIDELFVYLFTIKVALWGYSNTSEEKNTKIRINTPINRQSALLVDNVSVLLKKDQNVS